VRISAFAFLGTVGLVAAGCATGEDDATQAAPREALVHSGPEVSQAIQHDVSPPLREIGVNEAAIEAHADRPIRLIQIAGPAVIDQVVQDAPSIEAATTGLLNFAGVGNGDYGFSPDAAPPDTNGAVGATQYVQWVNESFAVFDKATGARVFGPVLGKSLWAGFGGGCQNNNDGDPIVQYDKAANRWIMTQFSVSTTPYLQCVAVSTTSDATGSYNRYAFAYTAFPDYPKLGVWPDAYYITFNMFGSTFQGGRVCAYDRQQMLNGQPASQVCFQLSSSFPSLLPSDLDGSTAPPAGSPNYVLDFNTTAGGLNLWKFHVDFTTPANSTLDGPTVIATQPFNEACKNGGACIPQSGTSQKLDSLSDRLMYRLAYRNFGGHESLVVNHSVSTGRRAPSGIRWYELQQVAGGGFSVAQQATYAPADGLYRWMGSIAMDKQGNIALGYSESSSGTHPAIAYTIHGVSDPTDTMQAENVAVVGGGSQLRGLDRWGDYSAMSVDPVDDCTFYYTQEYLKANGTFNWSTRVVSFKVPGCL
jgi:hypothetical protein